MECFVVFNKETGIHVSMSHVPEGSLISCPVKPASAGCAPEVWTGTGLVYIKKGDPYLNSNATSSSANYKGR